MIKVEANNGMISLEMGGPYDDNGQTASKFAHAVLELTRSVMRGGQNGK